MKSRTDSTIHEVDLKGDEEEEEEEETRKGGRERWTDGEGDANCFISFLLSFRLPFSV